MSSWGYWMDGICDAIGTVLFFFAAWILLQKRHQQKNISTNNNHLTLNKCSSTENLFHIDDNDPLLPTSESNVSTLSRIKSKLYRISSVTIIALLLQQFFGSLFWNRYMTGFHELLEVPAFFPNAKANMERQIGVFKSSPFWIISWSWKILNPHSMMSFCLCFVFLDLAVPVFTKIRFLGFVPLFALIVSSELLMQTIIWRV